jgi:hypothetical protein
LGCHGCAEAGASERRFDTLAAPRQFAAQPMITFL